MKRIIKTIIGLFLVNGSLFCQDSTYHFGDVSSNGSIEFIANKIKFRIHLKDSIESIFTLEKYNESWVGWTVIDSIDEYHTFLLRDVNNDGYRDLELNEKWNKELYFYNPNKNTFIHTGSFSWLGDEMILLDKAQHIYYDYQPYKRGEWKSYLFTIKNYKRIDLGVIEGESEYDEEKEGYLSSSISIKKIIAEDNEIEISKPKVNPTKDYNSAAYWKLNWRKFLHKK